MSLKTHTYKKTFPLTFSPKPFSVSSHGYVLYEKYRFSITFSNKLGGFYCGLMCVFILCYSGVFNLQERGARGLFVCADKQPPPREGRVGAHAQAGSSGARF